MNFILDNYNKLKDQQGGKKQFSEIVCQITPYFKTIEPEVVELREGYGAWKMHKRREVENHIGTVHAIACCNLCEITAGLTIEVSIPEHKRWIPMGMQVQYLKKAKTDLVAECNIGEPEWDSIDKLDIDVYVKDEKGQVVVAAVISMKVGDKPA